MMVIVPLFIMIITNIRQINMVESVNEFQIDLLTWQNSTNSSVVVTKECDPLECELEKFPMSINIFSYASNGDIDFCADLVLEIV